MSDIFTPKQAELIKLFKLGKLRRINILHGSVRSGKTWISLVLWALWVATMPEDKAYIMVAKTLTSLKRNCLDLLQSLVGEENFSYSLAAKEGRLFGRKIYLEGVNDARSESKIRGMSLQGAYCDELTLFTEDFFEMLLSRLSETGAKLFATTNPDSPYHWVKHNFMERQNELDMLVMPFLIEENTFLDPEYVEQLKNEYKASPVHYDRFILGLWVVASGLIYPFFKPESNPELTGNEDYYISVDYGTMNPCSMGLWAVDYRKETATRIREFYYDGRKKGKPFTDREYYIELEKLAGDFNIECVVVDPSAASFIAEIREHGRFDVRKGNNDVLDGIRLTGKLLKNGNLKISDCCKNSIKEFQSYVWDEKSVAEDKPLKENDHAMDDIRYFCNTILKYLGW